MRRRILASVGGKPLPYKIINGIRGDGLATLTLPIEKTVISSKIEEVDCLFDGNPEQGVEILGSWGGSLVFQCLVGRDCQIKMATPAANFNLPIGSRSTIRGEMYPTSGKFFINGINGGNPTYNYKPYFQNSWRVIRENDYIVFFGIKVILDGVDFFDLKPAVKTDNNEVGFVNLVDGSWVGNSSASGSFVPIY